MSASPTTTRAAAGATLSRRGFLRNAGLALAAGAFFPTIIPSRALGRDGAVAPSNRLTMGLVGCVQGWSDLNGFMHHRDVQPTAICDVNIDTAKARARDVDNRYGTKGTRAYQDFREMFAKEKLDTVIIAPPDHWHAIIAIAAARAGIDIYGEKPLAHTLVEGRAIANAVKQHGRVWQTGSWQRSGGRFYEAVRLVRAGAIGKVKHVKVGTLATQNGFSKSLGTKPELDKIGKPPPALDYDLWLGPAAHMDYDPRWVGYHWRWILNFGGGNLMDWVGHHVDIAQWGLDFDETGPVEVTGSATFSTKLPWDAATKYEYKCTYADGTVIEVNSGFASGTRFIGEDDQYVYVDRGAFKVSKSVDSTVMRADGKPTYRSPDHNRNFLDCVKTRSVTITPIEAAHRAASVGHLGHIACLTGRKIHWDPVAETIKDDPAATALLSPNYRSPWVL